MSAVTDSGEVPHKVDTCFIEPVCPIKHYT